MNYTHCWKTESFWQIYIYLYTSTHTHFHTLTHAHLLPLTTCCVHEKVNLLHISRIIICIHVLTWLAAGDTGQRAKGEGWSSQRAETEGTRIHSFDTWQHDCFFKANDKLCITHHTKLIETRIKSNLETVANLNKVEIINISLSISILKNTMLKIHLRMKPKYHKNELSRIIYDSWKVIKKMCTK